MPTALPPNHPERLLLSDEVHARPPELVATPSRATYLAVLVEQDERASEHGHVVALCRSFAVEPPPEITTHFAATLGPLRLKWERHGEFSSYTFLAPGGGDGPFAEPVVGAAAGGLACRCARPHDRGGARGARVRAGAPSRRCVLYGALRRQHAGRGGGRRGERRRVHRLQAARRRLLPVPRLEPSPHRVPGRADVAAAVRDRGVSHARAALPADRAGPGNEDRRDRALARHAHATT